MSFRAVESAKQRFCVSAVAGENALMTTKELEKFFNKNLAKFESNNFKDAIAAVIWEISKAYLKKKNSKAPI